jgi:hypothetical protein
MAECLICHLRVRDPEILEHLRLMHPAWDETGGRFVDAVVYRSQDFDDGLRCPLCDHVFEEGEAYTSVPEKDDGGIPIQLIVCMDCGIRAVLESP